MLSRYEAIIGCAWYCALISETKTYIQHYRLTDISLSDLGMEDGYRVVGEGNVDGWMDIE